MLIPVNNPELLEFIAYELDIKFDRISDTRWKRIDEAITKVFMETIADKEILTRLLDREGTKKILASINKKLGMNSQEPIKKITVNVETEKNVSQSIVCPVEEKSTD